MFKPGHLLMNQSTKWNHFKYHFEYNRPDPKLTTFFLSLPT
jgi:hypothetical protein